MLNLQQIKLKTQHICSALRNKISDLKFNPKTIYPIDSWGKLIAVIAVVFIFLYYPLGAFFSSNINTDTSYEPEQKSSKSAIINAASELIYREVYINSWTPSLPFVFPASMLDNMPAFQLGVMSAINKTVSTLEQIEKLEIAATNDKHPLQTAAELLRYPGTIWMFSSDNKLIPAPSSNSQYRKARKQLQKYAQMLNEGRAVYTADAQSLKALLQKIEQDLIHCSTQTETHIREHSSDFFDFNADDVFFYEQGKLYGYYILLKAATLDYKDVLLQYDVYTSWTSLLRALQNASEISPFVIRNANRENSFAPNHLIGIDNYALKAAYLAQKIIKDISLHQLTGASK